MSLPEVTAPRKLVIWHSEGTAISGLLSWMWRLKKSLPAAGIELTLVSLELQPFRFTQVCAPDSFYDHRIRNEREFVAFLKNHQQAIHLINHAYEYVDLLEKLRPEMLARLSLVGICHTDQDYYYHHLARLDARLAGIIAVSPRCQEKLEQMLPHRRGTIPVLPDWDLPFDGPMIARANQDPTRPLRVLYNGRLLHLQKRVLDLPEISRRLAVMKVPVHLTIAGDGPDLPRLRDAFSRGRHIPNRLLGPRAPWEMAPLLVEHDIFLQTSEFEGASVSLMEAMVAGLVPVVTGTESGTELLENARNSLICPVGDVACLACRIAELAENRAPLPMLGGAAARDARAYLKALNYPARLRHYLNQLPLATAPRMLNLIIPTANRAVMLRTALRSVAGQVELNKIDRIYVSENGGTRDSEAVCAEFPQLPITYLFRSPQMTPLEHGKLLMTELAQGDYTAILHDDDWWAPQHIGNAVRALEANPDANIYSSGHFVVTGESSMLNCSGNLFPWFGGGYPEFAPWWKLSRLNVLMGELLGTICHYSTMVIRSAALREAAYVYDLGNTFDNDRMLVFALSVNGALLYNPTPEVFVRNHVVQDCFQFDDGARKRHMCGTTRWMVETSGKSWDVISKTFAKRMALCPAEARATLKALSLREWCLPEINRNLSERVLV